MNRNLKSFVAAALLMCAAAGAVGTAAARDVFNLSAGWTFFTSDDPSTDGAANVNLPHILATTGTFNYIKQIAVPASWEGRRVFLRIGGAANVADVFIDGLHCATHRGASAPFTVEITRLLRWGTPATVRIVADSSPRLDVLPIAGREKVYGGLYRGVELIVCDPLAISPAAPFDGNPDMGTTDGLWIATDRLTPGHAEGRVRLGLLTPAGTPAADMLSATDETTTPDGSFARVRFLDAEGNLAAQSSLPVTSATLDIPFTLSDPHLWQGADDPYLYEVEVTLFGPDGTQTDRLTTTTGFRTVAIDPEGNFTLNGRPITIHGVVLQRDRMMVGTALTPFQIEEDVALILEMGANAVRVAGGRHSDYFYTLCDESGLLVMSDGPFTGAAYPTDIDFVDTPAFRDNGRRQLGEMISGLYNHPSVVAWGVFSNVTARGGNPVPYIRALTELVRDLDPSRLTAAGSTQDGEVNFITDIVSFDLSLGWESGLPDGVVLWLDQLRTGWPYLRAGISYGAGASILHQSERLERPSSTDGYHPEGWQTFFHEEYVRYAVDAPGLWGVFVANMFDTGEAKVPPGSLTASVAAGVGVGGAIDDRGLVTFDRKDRKDAFWLYKALWNTSDPFVRIAGSRLDGRSERRQTIRVYSNRGEVELFVGGRSQGRHTGERGVFVWSDVNLRPGLNRLEARAEGTAPHRISITLTPSATTSQQPEAAPPVAPPTGSGVGSGVGSGIGLSGGEITPR